MFNILPGSISYLESLSNLWLPQGNQKQSASSPAWFPRCWESRMLAEGKIGQYFIFQFVVKELVHCLTCSISEFYSLILLPNALNGNQDLNHFVFFRTAPHIKLHTFLHTHIICTTTNRLRPIFLRQICFWLQFQFIYTWHQNHKKFT